MNTWIEMTKLNKQKINNGNTIDDKKNRVKQMSSGSLNSGGLTLSCYLGQVERLFTIDHRL
ncbi:hypothetical protein RND71_014186 [Anisodus tanguticus]|uniref:Uncharacterized protein n=1 Tax=Anisodus tanguticus TaxID=243964 RepID=A0AAE1SCD0_9SOLA|nr:hypothetical protein RND71_014186 [Anisodus tanguticus]